MPAPAPSGRPARAVRRLARRARRRLRSWRPSALAGAPEHPTPPRPATAPPAEAEPAPAPPRPSTAPPPSARPFLTPPAPVPAPRATFHDPDLQAAFERDGYVVVDLLDAVEVAELQARYDAHDHQERIDYPFVEGFDTSLYDTRPDHRAAVLADFEAVLAPELDRVLDDHRIMFANYAVKVPQGDDVPLHVDWTFLDESRFSSATVWCPLLDTSVEAGNGPLGVVVGSHRRINFLRIVNLPCYDRCTDAVADLEHRTLPVQAGQAIVMDNRVVHYSLPNQTDRRRVVAACVVGPAEAALHHYWLDPEDRLLRFELDRSFYLGYAVGNPTQAPGVLRVDEVGAPVGA